MRGNAAANLGGAAGGKTAGRARVWGGGWQEDGWPCESAVRRELAMNTKNTKNSKTARKTWHDARSLVGNQNS